MMPCLDKIVLPSYVTMLNASGFVQSTREEDLSCILSMPKNQSSQPDQGGF